jgi:hypothetical protein
MLPASTTLEKEGRMTPKKVQQSSDDWKVEVVAYDGMTLAPGGVPDGELTQASIDKLLDSLMLFAKGAGDKLNALDICPSELTIEGHVSLDVGGGVLLFGVSAGISVSMTWKFEEAWTATLPRGGKRSLEPEPRKP